jgi:hypothetical protein
VIITVVTMRMVQMAVNEVVDMVAMWDGLVSAVRAMNVGGIVTTAGMRRSARLGIRVAHRENVFLDSSPLRLMMQVAIMQVVHMPLVFDGCVTAACSVLVIVILMTL